MRYEISPLANVTAVLCTVPGRLAEFERRVRQVTHQVVRPAAGWVVGIEPLIGSVPDPEALLRGGVTFLEGREHLLPDDPAAPEVEAARRKLERPDHHIAPLPYDVGAMVFSDHEALVIRSVSGRVPIYVCRLDDTATVISTLLCRQIQISGTAEIDPFPFALASSSGPIFPDGRTPLRGVTSVPPATVASIAPSRMHQEAYWTPPPPATAPTENEALGRQQDFRSALFDVLRRELDPHHPSLLALSGGVDSACLAVLTGKLERPVKAYTYDTEGSTPEGTHNRRFVSAAIDEGSIGSHTVDHLDDHLLLDWISEGPISVLPIAEPTLSRLTQFANEDHIGFMGGWFADEATGGLYGFDAWVRTKSWRDLLRPRDPIISGRRSALRAKCRGTWQRHADRRVNLRVYRPEWWGDGLLAEYEEWSERASRPEWASHPRAELLVAHLIYGAESHWEVTSGLGIRSILPFVYKPILDVSYQCHPDELLQGATKTLLRGALAADVSHLLLGRRDKGRFATNPRTRFPVPDPLPDGADQLLAIGHGTPRDLSPEGAQALASARKGLRDMALFVD